MFTPFQKDRSTIRTTSVTGTVIRARRVLNKTYRYTHINYDELGNTLSEVRACVACSQNIIYIYEEKISDDCIALRRTQAKRSIKGAKDLV